MDLLTVTALCAGLFALLHFLFVPRALHRFRHSAGVDKLGASRRLAALQVLRLSLLLATLSCLLAIAVSTSLLALGGASAAEVAGSLARLRSIREFLDQAGTGFAIFAVAMLVIAIWHLASRKAEQHTQAALSRAIELERARVREERRAGRWESLPPNESMAQMQQRTAQLEQACAEIDQALRAGYTHSSDKTPLPVLKERAVSEMEQLRLMTDAEDERRRMNVDWHPPELEPAPPETRAERIQAFFFSRGLMQSLQGTGRVLFVLATLLLVPSLLGVAALPVAQAAEARQLKLEELYVSLQREEAQKSWDQVAAAAPAAPVAALQPEDEEALDRIAAAYELSVARSMAALAARRGAAIPHELASYRARSGVLQEFSRHTADAPSVARVATAQPHVGPLHDDFLHISRPDVHGPVTPEGRAFRERLRKDVALRSSEQWNRFKGSVAGMKASFARPATMAELEGALISRLVGFTGADPDAGKALLAASGPDGLPPATRARAFDTRSHEFMSTLARSGKIDEAMARTSASAAKGYSSAEFGRIQTAARQVPTVEALSRHIQSSPPTVVRDSAKGVDIVAARKAGANLTSQLYGAGGAARPLPALQSFDDFFPGHALPSASTAGASPGGGGGGQAKFRQARSYAALRGSPRIGGVLIGRQPESVDKDVDFVGVRWTIDRGNVQLQLRHADGTERALGPFRASLVHSALAYAADGRPVAVTMTSAAPLAELRINLHPALVDSRLGCRAIELDRYVDAVTSQSPALQKLREEQYLLVLGQARLYRMAWARVVLGGAGAAWIARVHAPIAKEIAERARQEAAPEPGATAPMLRALAAPQALLDPARSPLSSKPEFFSPLVVKLAAACAARAKGAIAPYAECVEREAARLGPADFDKNPAWDAPPPDFVQWSGVRELPYSIDSALAFGAPRRDADPLAPFQFILQLAFESPAFGASKRVAWFEDRATVDEYADPQPWQFPGFQDALAGAVREQVRRNAEWSDAVSAMREFTLLQRLFQAAFAGKLGAAFPVDELVRLARDTAKHVAPQRTLRWNVRPGAIEARFLAEAAAAKAAPACVRQFGTLTPQQLSSLPAEQWDAKCRIEPGSAGEQIARRSLVISEARRIRQSLNVREDEALAASRTGCMPL